MFLLEIEFYKLKKLEEMKTLQNDYGHKVKNAKIENECILM